MRVIRQAKGVRNHQHTSVSWLLKTMAISTLHLSKLPSIRRKVESVMIWAGLLLVATIPLMLGIMMIEAYTDTSPDKGGAVAAFFMLIIFGGAYGGLGVILLIAGFVQRRNRRAAEPQSVRPESNGLPLCTGAPVSKPSH